MCLVLGKINQQKRSNRGDMFLRDYPNVWENVSRTDNAHRLTTCWVQWRRTLPDATNALVENAVSRSHSSHHHTMSFHSVISCVLNAIYSRMSHSINNSFLLGDSNSPFYIECVKYATEKCTSECRLGGIFRQNITECWTCRDTCISKRNTFWFLFCSGFIVWII